MGEKLKQGAMSSGQRELPVEEEASGTQEKKAVLHELFVKATCRQLGLSKSAVLSGTRSSAIDKAVGIIGFYDRKDLGMSREDAAAALNCAPGTLAGLIGRAQVYTYEIRKIIEAVQKQRMVVMQLSRATGQQAREIAEHTAVIFDVEPAEIWSSLLGTKYSEPLQVVMALDYALGSEGKPSLYGTAKRFGVSHASILNVSKQVSNALTRNPDGDYAKKIRAVCVALDADPNVLIRRKKDLGTRES